MWGTSTLSMAVESMTGSEVQYSKIHIKIYAFSIILPVGNKVGGDEVSLPMLITQPHSLRS